MRVLRSFILFFLFIILVSVSGFLIAREVLLAKAASDIRTAIRSMEKVAYTRSEYANECIRKGGISGQSVSSVELRFMTEKEYRVVAVCEYFRNEPIFVTSYTLPQFVEKIPGEAGLIWDPTGKSGIQLSMWGLEKTIILDGTDFIVHRGLKEIDGNRPPAVCQGFGYTCCDGVTEVGVGEAMSAAGDCPESCFLKCESRPVVLRLYSDPPPDLRTKITTISSGTEVSFFYTIDSGQGEQVDVTVDFGDGQKQVVSEAEGIVTHAYQCATAACEYTATVQASDAFARKSVITPVSSLLVRVQ